MYKIKAYLISDNIDIELFKTVYTGELINSNYYELFYETDTEQYISVFKYGVVCFLNTDEKTIDEFTKFIANHCVYFYDGELYKEYEIDTESNELKFTLNKSELNYCDIETMRVIMLNIAQSIALDHYYQQAKVLLGQANSLTSYLEKHGKLLISDKALKKFIGKTINLKNRIIENLHLFDSISEIGHNDFLIKVDIGMKEALYVPKRSENVHEELSIIREQLELFSDIMHHSTSTKQELIVIILVFIEVFDIIIRGYILN